MSRKFPVVVFLLTLAAALVLVGQQSLAQENPPAPPAQAQGQGGMGGGSMMGPMTPENRLKMLTEKLNLTEDQQTKIKPVLEDENSQMKAIHSDSSLTPQDRRAKMKSIHESSTEKINAVLTPDQQAKWKQMKQEMMEKHKEMKGQGAMDHQMDHQ